ENIKKLDNDQNARRLFLNNGSPLRMGEVFRNPQLASALKLISSEGAPGFYQGSLARAILKTSDRLGGKMAMADLSEFESEWVDPISTQYRGWKIYELPPSGQGIAALEMLNIMSLFQLPENPSRGIAELHTEIEAQKLAYADLHRYVADMRFAKVPVAGMISMGDARERAAPVDAGKARWDGEPGEPPASAGGTPFKTPVGPRGNTGAPWPSPQHSF